MLLGTEINTDASGNIYAAGFFYGVSDIDPGPGIFNVTSNGDRDFYISKFDPNGNFIWAKGFGGVEFDDVINVLADDAGNIYATGYFKSSVDFDPGAGTTTLTSAGGNDIFLIKFNTAGNFQWAKSMGSTGDDSGGILAFAADGSLYFSGLFRETVDFDPGAGTALHTSAGSTDIFLSNFTIDGDLISVKTFGSSGIDEGINSLAADGYGNVYLCGRIENPTVFDGITVESPNFLKGLLVKFGPVCIPSTSVVTEFSCGEYAFNAQTYAVSGTYTQTIQNASGCDSTITLNLTVGQPSSSLLTVTSCGSYTLNDLNYPVSGVYSQVLENVSGCDSTITLNLTVTELNTNVSSTGMTAVSEMAGATYQWLNCSNGYSPIPGATSSSYTAVANGNYAVKLTVGNCSDTSECILLSGLGVEEYNAIGFSVSPNPADGKLTVSMHGILGNVSIYVLSANGQIVYKQAGKWGTDEIIDLTDLSAGLYYVQVIQDNTIVGRERFILK